MATRLATVLTLAALFLIPGHAASQSQSLKIRLTYATTHGNLKTVAAPAGKNMPRLGIALAGGGAKASASIGVLKVLAREGIPVAAIAGTSMGAGVGGLFAAGYSPEEIEKIFLENDWNDIFTDTPRRVFQTQEQKESGSRHLLEFTFYRGRFMPPSGLSAGQKLTNLLASKTLAASFEADFDFDKLKIPFRAVATDIENGNTVVIGRGLLHEAIRASAAIPLVFQPVEIQGRMLVDGGLVNNLPVDVVKSMGVDVVIAVDASSKLDKKEQLATLLEIMSQSISLQVRRESERQAALADLVITPDTTSYLFTDFPAMHEIVRKGEEAAEAALPRIRELMKPRTMESPSSDRYRITRLDIRGNTTIPDAAIRNVMTPVLSPRESAVDELQAALGEVFRLGWFADVSLDLEKEIDGTRAVLTVEENPVVQRINLSGNTIIPTSDILATLSWQKGQVLNSTRLRAELDRFVATCKNRGYLLTRVERVDMNTDRATLEIEFYEGRVDFVTIAGQKRTKRSLIQRETGTRPGSPLNVNTAAYDIQHLYALDYFESVSADMTKSPQGGIDITLRIKEKPTTKVRLGLRYDLEDRFTGLTDIVMENVTGRGIKAYLTTRYGNYTDITLGYWSPIFLDTYFVHSMQALYQQRNYLLYEDQHKVNELDITRIGAEFAFGYQWFRFGDTYLRYRYAADSAEETLGANPARDVTHIGSLAFLTTIDTRDRNIFPHTGILLKGSYESARPAYGSTNAFTKTALSLQGAIPIAERHTLILEGSGGLGSGDMPYQEKFGIGGADYLLGFPLAGYQRREFTGSDELGFSAAWRWMIREYHLKAVKAVYLNLTGQAANVWERSGAVSVDHLRTGAGIGLHADTIIGPMRLDFGAGAQNRHMIYFSAGFDF
ncbi:MAG: patatin-like phospholipase family protein [Nitrospirae bacterium]|nr:patatin-like phospholipase family protein [Nitrospirota bacterium]